MDKVKALVESARHLSLHPLDTFHSTLDDHLTKIYNAFPADATEKAHFFQTTQGEPTLQGKSPEYPLVSIETFRSYMKGAAACAEAPAQEVDAEAPISDYFISSSHNTYLTGNQLYSDAAASAYTSVLLRGCRSVEIDVWDGLPEDSGSEGSGPSSSDSASEEASKGAPKASFKEKIMSRLESRENPGSGLTRSVSKQLSKRLSWKVDKPQTDSSVTTTSIEPVEKAPVKAEPRVLHGHTLTKGTTFREICYAIRDSAFVTSDLPIIISFEVHANLEQQQMMVDIIHEAWKGHLVEVPEGTDPDAQPKLSELKRKILIKTKSTAVKKDTPESSPPANKGKEVLDTPDAAGPETDAEADPEDAAHKAKPKKVLEALAKMAVYTRAYHFSHFDQPEAKVPNHVFSLSEKAAREAHVTHRDTLFEHNRSALMRIYPYAFRVTSSNLDPTFYWRRGAQLVALNWQNLDKGMMLNYGMFHGTQGWQLKPPVEVFAAQDLALPLGHTEKGFSPYLVVQLHVEEPEVEGSSEGDDASSDTEKSSYRRRSRNGAGRCPDFEGQKLVFPAVVGIVEELSFVRFKIKDDEFGRDPLAAWACIRLDRLRNGYRLVHLRDATGERTGGVLLVRVTKVIS
ncbi:hypothetical protein N7470_004963 [Penicillium chermesinum]|nr:hypothetical protein N7470_004963 [Penicillium chermesinum]